MSMRKVHPDGDDTKGLPLFDSIGGCDATVPAAAKLEAGGKVFMNRVDEHGRMKAPVCIGSVVGEPIIHAPFSNSTTSRDAAADITPKLGDLEELVLEAIRTSCDGLTCDEVETYAQLTHQCASARIRGLVLKGKLKDSGRTRKTRSGRSAIVWSVA